MKQIVDTSVVVKWFVSEEGEAAAEALIGQALLAPDLLLIEVSNVAWQKWRRKEIGREQAEFAQTMVSSFVEFVPSQPFAKRALAIAMELDHPLYDCIYLAAAESFGLPIITADKRMIVRCAKTSFSDLLKPLEHA